MTVQAGTITGINLLYSKGARKTYEVCVDFPAYTGSTDTFSIAAVGAGIRAKNRNGTTHTLLQAMCIGGGYDTAQQAIFAGACTVSTDALTGNLTTSDGTTEITTSTASKGVRLAVTVTES